MIYKKRILTLSIKKLIYILTFIIIIINIVNAIETNHTISINNKNLTNKEINVTYQNVINATGYGDIDNLKKYKYQFKINCTNISDGIPFVINGSSGVMFDNQTHYIWTVSNGDYINLRFNNKSEYIIIDSHALLPFFVETGDGKSNKPELVFDKDTYTTVLLTYYKCKIVCKDIKNNIIYNIKNNIINNIINNINNIIIMMIIIIGLVICGIIIYNNQKTKQKLRGN